MTSYPDFQSDAYLFDVECKRKQLELLERIAKALERLNVHMNIMNGGSGKVE